LTGPRQVGKTTLLKHLRKKIKHSYVSLDEFEIRSLAKNDPALFLQQNPPPLIIDEIQYAPQLLPYIKAEADKKEGSCSYWITGSQHFYLMRGVSESLAGRIGILKLLGFSRGEEKNKPLSRSPWDIDSIKLAQKYSGTNLKLLFQRIIKGSFPRLFQKNAPPLETFYGSYIQTYIDRDLRDMVRQASISSFEIFLRLCAARTGQMLNLSDLARDSNISVNTAKEWLSLLEASGQIFFLRPYYKNISKRLIKTPKMYFLDTGLVCYLTGWKTAETAAKGAMAGALFETFVVGEIIRSYWNHGQEVSLWYFRTKEKDEVDIVIEKDGKLYPIEIKLASRITAQKIKGIKSLAKTKAILGKSLVISTAKKAYSLDKNTLVVPYTIVQDL